MYVCVCYMYVCVHVCMCVCVYVYVYVLIDGVDATTNVMADAWSNVHFSPVYHMQSLLEFMHTTLGMPYWVCQYE